MPQKKKKKRLSKKERLRRRKQQVFLTKLAMAVGAILIIALIIVNIRSCGSNSGDETETASQSAEADETAQESALLAAVNASISEAEALAVQYDYDGAIELLESIDGYETNAEVITLLADYEAARSSLVTTAPTDVTHIFFHSLIVDAERGFSLDGSDSWNSSTAGYCQWMVTIDEFKEILQQMYDNGYVIVSIYDLVEETTDDDGTVHMTAKSISLPEGKIPFVLSIDDLSYYHSYSGRGIATRLIIDEDGTPTCEYVDADGVTQIGSYDCVPILDDFLEEHPDFSYKGAKGIIALTGYNGVFGYRTDYCYRDNVELTADQQAYLDSYPEYDWDAEVAAATAVADCLKADGWIFASHTWGHIRVGDADISTLQTDTEKWLEYVEPIIGETDIIVFAHGQDIASWTDDYASTEKFQYLKEQGFNIFCNVDSTTYSVQIEDEYLRMGRRNIDGYRMYQSLFEKDTKLDDLFDVSSVWDALRPSDSYLYEL